MIKKYRFVLLSAVIFLTAASLLKFTASSDIENNLSISDQYWQSANNYSHLKPRSDFDNDLAINAWCLSAVKDLKSKAKEHTGKYIKDLTIDDIYGSRTLPIDNTTLGDIYLRQGYVFDRVPNEESLILSGNGHGIILHAAEYRPSADILSSKDILKKGKLNKDISFIIYKELYEDLFKDLAPIESDIQNLAAYVPIEIVEEVFERQLPDITGKQRTMDTIFTTPLVFDNSTVVSIDLSGFTAMTDHLTRVLSKEKDPMKQGEAKKFVIDITNELFADIESAIEKLGGSVIKFGGDARLVLFSGENTATRALEMSQEVQIIIRYFGGIIKEFFTEAIGVDQLSNIRASIGMSSGTATLLIASDKSGLRDVIPIGDTFDRTIAAEDASNKDIVITEETRRLLISEGRRDLFTLYKNSKLPDDLYDSDEKKKLADKKLYVVNQDKLNFLDYEVRDRVNFTIEYINAVYDYLKENKFKDADPNEIKNLSSDFETFKDELRRMSSDITIGDLSTSSIRSLAKMKKRVRKIRVVVDEHLLKFFPEDERKDIEATQDTLAKLSLKKDYGRYIADRVGELFRRFRKTAREKAFYSKDTLTRAKKIFVSFLPRDFDQFIVKEGKKDASVERMNFQNARIMFVQAYGTKELFEETLEREGPEKAQEKVNEFFNEIRRMASPNNGIIYLKCDPGIGYIKLIFFGGLKYISGINPDAEMVKLGIKLHKIGEKYGIQFRAGINSGPVIFGLTGTARNEYTTISAAVNMAARYAAKAGKGETLITSRIYYGSRDWVEHKERGDLYPEGKPGLMLKGIRDPQRAFQPVSTYKTQKRGAFLRLKEFNTAQKLIDNYANARSQDGEKGGFDSILLQTKELGLGSETLAYEIERYAGIRDFKTYGGKGKDEFEIMKNLLEEFFEISPDEPSPERLKKINYSASKYAPDMIEYIPVLKILFPFIQFNKSAEVENLEDDEKITVLNKLAQTLFTNKESELKQQTKPGIFIRIFDLQNIKGESIFLNPLLNVLNDKNIFTIFVCNAALPETIGEIEIQPLSSKEDRKPEPTALSKLLSTNGRTIPVDKMTKDQILDVFHYTCKLRDKTALLKEAEKLSHEEIRDLIATAPDDQHKIAEALGLAKDRAFSHIPLADLHSHVKKLIDDKIYRLSGQGNPLIARHQAKLIIDKFHHEDLPETGKGRFIIEELLRQKIAGDNIDDFFYTQYRDTYFENKAYREILFDALCLGPDIDKKTLIENSRSRSEKPEQLIDELIEVGILSRSNPQTIIFDHYVYDVFIKHVDIDKLRRNKLKLAHLSDTLYKTDAGSIDPDHIGELAQLYTDSFNLNLSWKKQNKTLGVNEEDLKKAAEHNLAASERYVELVRLPEAIKAVNMAISVLDYRIKQNLAGDEDNASILSAYKSLGELYKTIGDYENALAAFNSALNYCTNDIDRIGILFDGITFIQFRIDKIAELEKTLAEVESIIPHIEPVERRNAFRINFLNRIGLINQSLEKHDLAKQNFTDAIELCEKTGTKNLLGKSSMNLGLYYRDVAGNLKKSTELYEHAYKICKETDSDYQAIIALENLATNYTLLGHPEKTAKASSEAVALIKKLHFTPLLTTPYTYWGESYRLRGNYKEALGYYREAERNIRLFDARPDEKADLYKGMGVCIQDDHPESVKYLRKALSNAAMIKSEMLRTMISLECYGYLIEEYLIMGNIKKAEDTIREIDKLAIKPEMIKSRDIALRLNVIDRIRGNIAFNRFRSTENIEDLNAALTLAYLSFNKARESKHPLGEAKALALMIKAFNNIPYGLLKKDKEFNEYISIIEQVLASRNKVLKYLQKSKIPSDKLLLAEIYLGIGNLILPNISDKEKTQYYEGFTELAQKLIKEGNQEEILRIYNEGRLLPYPSKELEPSTEDEPATAA